MAGYYSLPTTSECDADSPLNEALFNTRLRGTLLGLGYANSVFGTFAGSGVDTTTGPTTTGNLDCGTAGKQYTSWSVPAGVTISLTTASGVHRIGVTGTFTLEGTLSADGAGIAGGAGGNGGDGASVTAVNNCGNGSACGGGGGGLDYGTGGYSGGSSACDGYEAAAGYGGGSYSTSGGDGTAAKTGVLGLWYANPANCSPGSGGGGGAGVGSGYVGFDGGNGGGLIIIECDTFVFASGAVITADGANSTNAAGNRAAGGGGGGGTVIVICRVLTTNLGTVTVSAGTGGTSFGALGRGGGDGGAGRYAIVVLGAQATSGTA